jgi:hypothetical protein
VAQIDAFARLEVEVGDVDPPRAERGEGALLDPALSPLPELGRAAPRVQERRYNSGAISWSARPSHRGSTSNMRWAFCGRWNARRKRECSAVQESAGNHAV